MDVFFLVCESDASRGNVSVRFDPEIVRWQVFPDGKVLVELAPRAPAEQKLMPLMLESLYGVTRLPLLKTDLLNEVHLVSLPAAVRNGLPGRPTLGDLIEVANKVAPSGPFLMRGPRY